MTWEAIGVETDWGAGFIVIPKTHGSSWSFLPYGSRDFTFQDCDRLGHSFTPSAGANTDNGVGTRSV